MPKALDINLTYMKFSSHKFLHITSNTIIKNRPKMKKNNEVFFKSSLEINGIGNVRAIYKEIRELLTGKSVLNFSVIRLIFYSIR